MLQVSKPSLRSLPFFCSCGDDDDFVFVLCLLRFLFVLLAITFFPMSSFSCSSCSFRDFVTLSVCLLGALHDADVGITVNTAVDVARDAAEIILLEKSLNVISKGVRQGRKVHCNTLKVSG